MHKISAIHIKKWIQSKGCCKTYVVILKLTTDKKWYGHADHLREKVHAGPPALSRTCSCQVGRANVTAINSKEYYRRAITSFAAD